MKKRTLLAMSLLIAGATTLPADATAAYKKCVSCHGAKGEKVALGKSKVIAEMTKQEISDSLKGYQNGTYGGVMKKLMTMQVKSLSEADIDAIAQMIGK